MRQLHVLVQRVDPERQVRAAALGRGRGGGGAATPGGGGGRRGRGGRPVLLVRGRRRRGLAGRGGEHAPSIEDGVPLGGLLGRRGHRSDGAHSSLPVLAGTAVICVSAAAALAPQARQEFAVLAKETICTGIALINLKI